MPKARVGGRWLYYDDIGRGEPLVFLSGLGGDHRAFAVTARAFATRYRVLSLDHRDVGQSERAGSGYSTADMADDVAGWLSILEVGPARVVGHSLGGLVAQQLAIRHPGAVSELVLASSHTGSSPWRKAVVESWVALKRRADAAEFTRGTLPWLAAPAFFRDEAQVEGLVRFAEKNAWPQEPDAFERQARAAMTHDAAPRLGEVRARTLVASGELDLVNPPPIARELAEAIPGARLVILPGVGHLPHIEDGAGFRAALAAFFGATAP